MKNTDIRAMLEEIGLYQGAVLTPEVASLLSEESSTDSPLFNGYAMIGRISPKMHEQALADSHAAEWRLKVYETPLKQMMFIVAVQLGSCQARLLMHLCDPKVQSMLQWAAQSGHLHVMLAASTELQIIHHEPRFYPEDLEPLLKLATENRRLDAMHTMVEMAKTAAELAKQKDMIICGNAGIPTEVTVTSIVWYPGMQAAEPSVEESTTIH